MSAFARNLARAASILVVLSPALSRADIAAPPPDIDHFLVQQHYGTVLTTPFLNHQYFPAQINGKQVTFILDTGAFRTCITRACARRLGLTVHDTGKPAMGVGGLESGTDGLADISSFTVRNWNINHLRNILVVADSSRLPGADGLFGFDTLVLNSAIVVLGGNGFMIRPGLFGRPAPIAGYLRADKFESVPLIAREGGILAMGTLNGHPLRAQIDSGASITAFDLGYLDRIGIVTRPTRLLMGGIDGRLTLARQFVASNMTIGTFRISTAHLGLATVMPSLEMKNIGVLIGFNFLRDNRAIIDTGSGVLWLK